MTARDFDIQDLLAKSDRVLEFCESILRQFERLEDNEEGWLRIACMQAALETWGSRCSDRKAYAAMLEMWRSTYTDRQP